MGDEYIKRQDALNAVDFWAESKEQNDNLTLAINMIPAADVVEVVRCGECKYYKDGWCYNPNNYDDEKTCGNTTPEWFCADGAKMDKEARE